MDASRSPLALAWIALVVADAEEAARVLEHHLGLVRRDLPAPGGRLLPVLAAGATRLVLCAPGDPLVGGSLRTGLHHVAFAVDDLGAAAARAVELGIAGPGAAAEPGLAGGARVALAPDALGGVAAWLTEPLPAFPPDPAPRVDHVGVASADNAGALAAFTGTLGFPLESTQTDVETEVVVESFTSTRYGIVQHARPPHVTGGLRVAFVTVGDCELEFLEDLDPSVSSATSRARGSPVTPSGPGTTRQDRSAIARFVRHRGPGLHHLAFRVPDTDGLLARLAEAGVPLIDRVGRPGSRRAKIGFLHPGALGGTLAHLVERPAY